MFLVLFVDFQQRKNLMFLTAYWIYKLKQVDISLSKHIKLFFQGFSIADTNRAVRYLEAGWTVQELPACWCPSVYTTQKHPTMSTDQRSSRSARERETEGDVRQTRSTHCDVTSTRSLLPASSTAQQTIGPRG